MCLLHRVTSLGFVSNGNDATVTLTRRVKVSLARIFIWMAPLGHCKGMFGNKLECIFLTKTGSKLQSYETGWARIGLRHSNNWEGVWCLVTARFAIEFLFKLRCKVHTWGLETTC